MKELGSSTVAIPCLRVFLVTFLKPKPVIMLLGPYILLNLSKLIAERTIIFFAKPLYSVSPLLPSR